MKQAHGTSLWQEPSGSGGTPTITPMKFVADGADFQIAGTGTEVAILADAGSGSVQFSTTLPGVPVLRMVMSKGDVVLY